MKLLNQTIAIIAFLLFSYFAFAADTKISDLTELTTPAADDELAIVDTSASETKRIAYGNPIQGDDVSKQVLRSIYLRLQDGTNANTVKAYVGSQWHGDIFGLTNNIAGGDTSGNFYLPLQGKEIQLLSGGLTGNCLGVLNSTIRLNSTNAHLTARAYQHSSGIRIFFYEAPNNGTTQDIRALVDNGQIYLTIVYITSE